MPISFPKRATAIVCGCALLALLMSAGQAAAQFQDQESDRNAPAPPDDRFFEEDRRQQDDYRSQRGQSSRYQDDQYDSSRNRSQTSNQQRTQGRNQRSTSQGGLGVTVEEGRQGPRITQVMRGTPAQKAGLREGDVIVEIEGDQVRSADDVVESIRNMQSGERLE